MKALKWIVGSTLVLTLSACGGSSDNEGATDTTDNNNAQTLTVVSWGGAYTFSQEEAFYKPWAAKTGNVVNSIDFSGGLDGIRDQVGASQFSWDVIDLEWGDVQKGCDEGLLETIDHSLLPEAPDGTAATEDFVEGTLLGCGVATSVWSIVVAYDTSVLTMSPTSIVDFFDTTTFPGKRGLMNSPKANLEMALMADGVLAADVYDLLATEQGLARAFDKLDTIKGDIVWWENGGESIRLLEDNEVVMTTAYNGRVATKVIEESAPFDILWDAQIWSADYWVIPKGSPKKAMALDFIHFSTSAEQLAKQASYIAYGPARKSSYALVGNYYNQPVDMKPLMPTAPQNMLNALQSGELFWEQNAASLNARFTAWVSE